MWLSSTHQKFSTLKAKKDFVHIKMQIHISYYSGDSKKEQFSFLEQVLILLNVHCPSKLSCIILVYYVIIISPS